MMRRLAHPAAAAASTASTGGAVLAFALSGETYGFLFVPFMLISALLILRRPENVIGPLLGAFGVLGPLNQVAVAYAVRGLVIAPGSLPLPALAAWFQTWEWVIYVGLLGTIFLCFPSGRVRSRRLFALLWLLVAATAVAAALLSAMPDERLPMYRNPVAPVLLWDYPPFLPLVFVVLLACALELVARALRSTAVERQQMKWVGYGAALFASAALISLLGGSLGIDERIGSALFDATFLLVPVTIAVAILRYRLYDIDVLINRTLVYGAVMAVLAVVYLGFALVLQTILSPFFSGSQLAVALSTLAVVALFQPLRWRIQNVVDRRFYRSKYDAERTLEHFARRLRDEIDLGVLERELLSAVSRTVRPRSASLWLRRNDERTVEA